MSGCQLYFGHDDDDWDDDDDRWSYCDVDGYYECAGDDCRWESATCPDLTCTSDADCAAGCYCSVSGVCEEAGFCSNDEQCGDGYHCDETRSSCVPDVCMSDAECDSGEYCDAATGGCSASCSCTDDASAQQQGWAYCDEGRMTCMPASAGGTCGGESTCNVAAPGCAEGEVPLILNGCYTGACQAIASCDVTPTCEALSHESDCLARTGSCSAVYTGINCTKPDGSACHAGDSGCTCQDFRFNSCDAPMGAARVFTSNGAVFEMTASENASYAQ
ncbi:MAG: hypothetical protein AB7P03_16835 [Kofleriaceae bacterium]